MNFYLNFVILVLIIIISSIVGREHRGSESGLNLWIAEEQVRFFSGFPMEIQAISHGVVLPYILDPHFQDYLPLIPPEVSSVNFTWKSGEKKYFYNFDRLQSFDEDILLSPTISIPTKGRIPKRAKSFTVVLPCSGLKSGIATFSIGLLIESRKGKALAGTPLRLRLRKECVQKSDDEGQCERKCENRGKCSSDGICVCLDGYMGSNCATALCYPQCMNNGTCIAPGKCSCPFGFHGSHCEGGVCSNKCLNGGKCVQKDTCECTSGYYGLRCEYSKCMIPCLNGGKCVGVNSCRCSGSYRGHHCEIGLYNRTLTQRHSCSLHPCKNGSCVGPNKCECYPGWYGKRCSRKKFL